MNQNTILDVRERDEFNAEHIENAILCPLSDFQHLAPGILNSIQGQNVTLMCRSGKRAELALGLIQKMGYEDKIKPQVFQGGMLQWKSEGKPIISQKSFHLPIMRQVQLSAGIMILGSTAMIAFGYTNFLYLNAFVGIGIGIAGLTGYCGLADFMNLMPWNRNSKKA